MGPADQEPDLGPVMTFRVAGEWLAVRVEQMDRVAAAPRLWVVPLALPAHVGIYDDGKELIPVLRLGDMPVSPATGEIFLAILHVRGESIGLAIERAGRVLTRYSVAQELERPAGFGGTPARRLRSDRENFWLVDTDDLWQEASFDGQASFRA